MNIYHIISKKEADAEVRTVFDLARRQHEDGNYVEIVCRPGSEAYSMARALEFPVSTLPLSGIGDVDSSVRLGRMIKKRRNCIVMAHNFKMAFVACMARTLSENKGVRVILMRHVLKRAKLSLLFGSLYRDIDAIIFPSEYAKAKFLQSKPRVDNAKLFVTPWSVTPIQMPVEDLHKKFGLHQDKAIICYSGELKAGSGTRSLLRGLSQIDPATYHLVVAHPCTNKSYARELSRIIVSNSMTRNITFLGTDNEEKIRTIMANTDIGIVPAMGKQAWPRTALRYMQLGVPVIVADNGTTSEYTGNCGITIGENNPYYISDALLQLISSPAKRRMMAAEALERYNSVFNYDNYADAINNICTDTLRK